MWLILLWAPLFTIGVYSIEGPGELVISNGGSLHVTFTYSRRYQNYMKYWCKGGYRPHCKVLISIQNDVFISRGRFSIRDDERKMQITVTMTGMQPNDSDIYHCGIQRLRQDVMHRVNVTVLPAVLVPKPEQPSSTKSLLPSCAVALVVGIILKLLSLLLVCGRFYWFPRCYEELKTQIWRNNESSKNRN